MDDTQYKYCVYRSTVRFLVCTSTWDTRCELNDVFNATCSNHLLMLLSLVIRPNPLRVVGRHLVCRRRQTAAPWNLGVQPARLIHETHMTLCTHCKTKARPEHNTLRVAVRLISGIVLSLLFLLPLSSCSPPHFPHCATIYYTTRHDTAFAIALYMP
jgi:hypothetical protein